MSERINIEFTRFSAFYSPLIATIAGRFLKAEGLTPHHAVSAPGTSAIASLVAGTADVVQSALSQGFGPCERGETPPAVHFAQINEMDGFFLTGRAPEPDFSWQRLTTARVIVDHGGQPLAMFKYACRKQGIDIADVDMVDAGNTNEMIAAFRAGEGDYIHLQGPAPQQLEHDGDGHVVASVGQAIGPVGFSSLAALPTWLDTDMAAAFMRAYRQARAWLLETPAADVARAERDFFPDIDPEVLAATIGYYQRLGCWTPHVEITPAAYDVTVDVFLNAGLISKRPPYEAIIAPPPG